MFLLLLVKCSCLSFPNTPPSLSLFCHQEIVPELFEVNLVRGRGLFARALMKAQLASPGFTPIFAGVMAVVNTKLPENGELLLKRLERTAVPLITEAIWVVFCCDE